MTVLTRAIATLSEQEGVQISLDQAEQLASYFSLLRRWNSKMNLTALSLEGDAPTAAIEKLLVEPLRALSLIINRGETRHWIDLGSGGGSPALPIRIAMPEAKLVLVESRAKKTAFLREVVRTLGLAHVEVRAERFESLLGESGCSAQLVTARAVRLDETAISVIRHLLSERGYFLSFGHVPTAAIPSLSRVSSDRSGTVLFQKSSAGA